MEKRNGRQNGGAVIGSNDTTRPGGFLSLETVGNSAMCIHVALTHVWLVLVHSSMLSYSTSFLLASHCVIHKA